MLILRLSKREDQALIPISTILKFSALDVLLNSTNNILEKKYIFTIKEGIDYLNQTLIFQFNLI